MDEPSSNPHAGARQFAEDVKLFACKLISSNALDYNQFQELVEQASPEIGLLDFAQLIIDQGMSADGEKIQEILYRACDDFDDGKRAPFDPFAHFEEDEEDGPDPVEKEKESRPPLRLLQPGTRSEDGGIVNSDGVESSALAPTESPLSSIPAEAEPAAEQRSVQPYDDESTTPKEQRKPISLNSVKRQEGSAEEKSDEDEEESLEDLVALAAEYVEKPARKKRRRDDSSGRAKINVDAEDIETLAAAAVSSLGEKNGALKGGHNAPMAEGGPVSAKSKAEKPSESIVSANGHKEAIPDFERIEGLNTDSAKRAMISLLLYCAKGGYSDLHISADARPFARKHGEIEYFSRKALSESESEFLNQSLLSAEQLAYFRKEKDYDFAIPFDSGHRFRTNFMVHKDGVAGTYRIVPGEPLPIEKLGFAPERSDLIKKLLAYHNGLILVTGPVGSGKTTTLASLVLEMNKTRSDHVICVEEPIEIVHDSDQCSVTQRGVGPHTNTFHSALKGALRQDPDIIVIGEMRDLETIEMAISASETGHLVIGTMHTSDAGNTLNRLLDVFPPAQQPQIRAMVAESLKGVVCQRLLPSVSGGVVLACELLLNNSAVASLIREGKSQGLGNVMETGKRDGMILMDNSVQELFLAGKISEETARANIKNEMVLRQLFSPAEPDPEPAPQASKKGGLFRR